MRWERLRRSENVEDQRGRTPRRIGAGGIGLGGLVIILVASMLLGVNPADLLGPLQDEPGATIPEAPQQAPTNDRGAEFVRAILGDTEDTWNQIFQKLGADYQEPRLVLFRGAVESACGFTSAAVGPFYCPQDERVYLDLSFFQQLEATAGASGDFARAYVIAHEIGHHVQNQLGIMKQVHPKMMRADPATRNALSVRLELQADCLAGVWGGYARQRKIIDPTDVEAALRAAAEIGDDQLQMKRRGYVVPEAFTHGSSEQRARWFRAGLEGGDPRKCDTFSGL